ncbi:hypothetical protein [Sphingomonas sp. 2378]|uniref:hypothetical protein n=1 Tax=Sphingomonas sp. 2378 TaxID=1219748 RepID=UPI00311AE1BA
MTQHDDAILRAYTVAATRLLLGNRKLKDGVVVTGGEALDQEDRTQMARTAALSGTDVVALEFGIAADGQFERTGITVYLPRDEGCYVQTDCRFWLSKAGNRAVILPRSESRGHFRMSPRELVHIDGKPAEDMVDGIARADAWLARRMGAKFAKPAKANLFSVYELA